MKNEKIARRIENYKMKRNKITNNYNKKAIKTTNYTIIIVVIFLKLFRNNKILPLNNSIEMITNKTKQIKIHFIINVGA
jgi:hypothetical protein